MTGCKSTKCMITTCTSKNRYKHSVFYWAYSLCSSRQSLCVKLWRTNRAFLSRHSEAHQCIDDKKSDIKIPLLFSSTSPHTQERAAFPGLSHSNQRRWKPTSLRPRTLCCASQKERSDGHQFAESSTSTNSVYSNDFCQQMTRTLSSHLPLCVRCIHKPEASADYHWHQHGNRVERHDSGEECCWEHARNGIGHAEEQPQTFCVSSYWLLLQEITSPGKVTWTWSTGHERNIDCPNCKSRNFYGSGTFAIFTRRME